MMIVLTRSPGERALLMQLTSPTGDPCQPLLLARLRSLVIGSTIPHRVAYIGQFVTMTRS
jgi:hypothetical protein